jgi:hypothetical protein
MLTENKTTNTEEAMHRIQFPSDHFLQVGGNFTNQEVEGPVRCGGERDTFRTDCERKYLGLVRTSKLQVFDLRHTSGGYNHGIGPQLDRIAIQRSPQCNIIDVPIAKETVVYDNADNHSLWCLRDINVHKPAGGA